MPPQENPFVGRTREIGQLRSALDSPEASILRVRGIRGVGKTALVRRALQGFDSLEFTVPPLPEPLQLDAFARALAEAVSDGGGEAGAGSEARLRTWEAGPPHTTWDDLLGQLLVRARPGRTAFVLVLDDAHRLDEARARHMPALVRMLQRARTERRALHVLIVAPLSGDPAIELASDLEADSVQVDPLPLRPATLMLPGKSPRDLLRAYSVLGGIPRVLTQVDRDLTLETNVRKLTLEPEAPFLDVPSGWLERDLQTPSRYNAILQGLARGECDWGAVRLAVPDLTSSGQLAPYVKRLEELGLVSVRRSLDAHPTSRARRYQIVDPFLAFWYRFMLPGSPEARVDLSPDDRLRALRSVLDDHSATVFPGICRQHMSHDARETLGANARELGSLWGNAHEIPVAGILTSGAAFYGACAWRTPTRSEAPLDTLERAARETRYGFGREHRIRVLFTATEAPRWLQRDAVRRDQYLLIGPDALVGERR
jgi:hypothetical protein